MRRYFKLIEKYELKKFWRYYSYYKRKMKGNYRDSYIAYSDFYYPEDMNTIETVEMKSGKLGIYKIYNVNYVDDWGSKNIMKDFIGYKGLKPIRECSLSEFMELYPSFLKLK